MKSRKSAKKENIFLEASHFLLDSKIFILFAVGLFFFSFLLGFLISPSQELLDAIKKFVEELLKQTEGMSLLQLIWFIFSNNFQVGFFSMIFGIFFGFFPFILTVANGYLVGFISLQSVSQSGIFSLWKLFPHGIFELPAIFISLGLGFRLGLFIFEKKEKSFWRLVFKSLKAFLIFVFPLLIIAAIIEASFIYFG